MKDSLISFFGIDEEHARMIDELQEPQRSRKIEELRYWREIKKLEF
ncbi:hypothetical protein [Streptococcus porcinus]|uniref:Uncharacterized protein n=1 Tax=Streptococcus porcinus TaxID=1340 RepID=A0A7V9WT43_STRPO|nr:hypothetical protein [Streptococcus porcinus]MBA2796586.1 hypothetical protein [Streptococcus porcinus]